VVFSFGNCTISGDADLTIVPVVPLTVVTERFAVEKRSVVGCNLFHSSHTYVTLSCTSIKASPVYRT